MKETKQEGSKKKRKLGKITSEGTKKKKNGEGKEKLKEGRSRARK